MDLETAYLEHILLFLRSGDPDDSLLTTCMNSWFAHNRGRPFIDDNQKARWLSKKSTKRRVAAHLHAISAAARKAVEMGNFDELVIDHTIPSAELIRGLRRRQRTEPFESVAELREYLRKRYTLALLTKSEHNNALRDCKSSMVGSWCDVHFETDQSQRYCRYGAGGGAFSFTVQVEHV